MKSPEQLGFLPVGKFSERIVSSRKANTMTDTTKINTRDLNGLAAVRQLLNKGKIQSMGNPKIIAIDPGETTGWSMIHCEMGIYSTGLVVTEKIITHEHGEVDCGRGIGSLDIDVAVDTGSLNPEGEGTGVARLMAYIDCHPDAVIVIEDFILERSEKSRDLLSAVRVTARLDQELWNRGRRSFKQDRANAKGTMNNARLKEFGIYQVSGGLGHARDADRHAVYFLRRCQTKPELRHQAWPFLFEAPVTKVVKPRKKREAGQRINFG